MSWCDKLASTPSVGFRLDWYFASGDEIFDALRPITNKLVGIDTQKFQVTRHESFNITFSTDNGYEYGVEPSKIFVNFQHKLKAKNVSGGLPVMEMLSTPRPYSELLLDVSNRLIEATTLIPGAETRGVTRVGVVAATNVSGDEMPPGIKKFFEYMRRPWGTTIDSFALQITAELEKSPGWTDRCSHTISLPETEEEPLYRLVFDWQRKFKNKKSIKTEILKEITSDARKAASEYFESLAEGSQFDEKILNSTT